MKLLKILKAFYMNEYKMLKQENLLRTDFLSTDDQVCLNKLLGDYKVTQMHVYDVELLKKELIGMGLEAKQRGSNLEAAIGGDEKAFVFEMIKGLRPASIRGRILAYGLSMALVTLFILALTLVVGFPAVYSFNIIHILLIPAWLVLFKFYDYLIVKRKYMSDNTFVKDKNDYVYRVLHTFTFIILITSLNYLKLYVVAELFTLPVWVVLIIVVVLSFAIILYNYFYSKRLAKERPWTD